jgi:PAS domain S-box-containing protein
MDKETLLLKKRISELERECLSLKKQKIAISEAKELYLKIFEDFPALIWRSRLDKLCDYFNKTWLEFTGRTMEQEFGNGWAEGVHPDDFDSCLKTYIESFDHKRSFEMEYRMKNQLGEYRWIRDYGRPFYDLDGTFLGYIGSCYDITESKNNELKLLELNATKDKFFSIIAHDLKNPFNSIIGFSEYLVLLVQEKEYEKLGEFANIIYKSANKAIDLLANLMAWSQSQSGRLIFSPEVFEIFVLAEDVDLILEVMAKQKSITINNNIRRDLLGFADKEMISTVLRNLISNALKFTSENGVININATEDANEIIISVADNGMGISSEQIDKLFLIHENHSTLGTLRETGTGLGLVLCKEFVEKNNGRIWVESQLAVGSTFYFSVPKGRNV